jgi:hypothetical protein
MNSLVVMSQLLSAHFANSLGKFKLSQDCELIWYNGNTLHTTSKSTRSLSRAGAETL